MKRNGKELSGREFRRKGHMRTALPVLLLCAALAAGTAGCGQGGSSASSSYYAEEPKEAAAEAYGNANYMAADMAEEESAYSEAAVTGSAGTDAGSGIAPEASNPREGQKIVYTGSVDLQTLAYQDTIANIRRRITEAGGFIESESESTNDYNWYSREPGDSSDSGTHSMFMVARVPSGTFSTFLDDMELDGKVMSRSVSAQNISQTYANYEVSREALETELARLKEMMDKAQTVEEMIAVESRMTEVERSLNSTKTTLAAMDKDVDYSTVHINITEVKRYSVNKTEATFAERLRRAAENSISSFVDFAEEVVLFIVGNWIFLLLLAGVITLIVRFRRRRKAQKEATVSTARKGLFRRKKAAEESTLPEDTGSGETGTTDMGSTDTGSAE